MDKQHADEFKKLLNSTMSGLRGEKVRVESDVLSLWWQALADFPFPAVRAALLRHVQTSTNIPRPADIISIINNHDGRPSADEAWPIAQKAADETETVLWTSEIEQAWFHCLDVYLTGDKVGARMAFRKRYERLIDNSRATNRPVDWHLTLGHDPRDRRLVVEQAMAQGQISTQQALQLAPPSKVTGDGKHVVALLGHDNSSEDANAEKASEPPPEPKEKTRRELKKIRKHLADLDKNREAEKAKRKRQEQARRKELDRQEQALLAEARKNHKATP